MVPSSTSLEPTQMPSTHQAQENWSHCSKQNGQSSCFCGAHILMWRYIVKWINKYNDDESQGKKKTNPKCASSAQVYCWFTIPIACRNFSCICRWELPLVKAISIRNLHSIWVWSFWQLHCLKKMISVINTVWEFFSNYGISPSTWS